jgi:hypothetical protein
MYWTPPGMGSQASAAFSSSERGAGVTCSPFRNLGQNKAGMTPSVWRTQHRRLHRDRDSFGPPEAREVGRRLLPVVGQADSDPTPNIPVPRHGPPEQALTCVIKKQMRTLFAFFSVQSQIFKVLFRMHGVFPNETPSFGRVRTQRVPELQGTLILRRRGIWASHTHMPPM